MVGNFIIELMLDPSVILLVEKKQLIEVLPGSHVLQTVKDCRDFKI